MALWFAGAALDKAPTEYRNRSDGNSGRGHLTLAQHQSHLDRGSLEPNTSYRSCGKRRINDSTNSAEVHQVLFQAGLSDSRIGAVPVKPGAREALKHFYESHLDKGLHPAGPAKKEGLRVSHAAASHLCTASPIKQMMEPLAAPAPPPPSAAPYASDINNTPVTPYVGLLRKVPPPRHENKHDGDAFVLVRSRTPPASARYRETSDEGFCVLLASSLKSRANPQMVMPRFGRSTAINAEADVIRNRNANDAKIAEVTRQRCEKAHQEESVRQAHLSTPQKSTGRGRCKTPPPSASTASNPPFALGLPGAARDIIGRSVIRQSQKRLLG